MKGIFANRSVLFQAGILSYLFLTGLVVGAISGEIFGDLFITITNSPFTGVTYRLFYPIHISQFLSCVLSFLLPAILTAYLCNIHPKNFLHIHKINVRVLISMLPMVIFLLPTVELTSYLNSKIQLPDFMSPIENLMRETEDKLTQITNSLLSEKGAIPFIVNIIVIAVMAGITEEFMFRGAILSIVRKRIKNTHVAIWIVATLFSAIHFQFYGFIPRLFLGAFFGYLLYWSKSIWAPVFAHFLHNAITVMAHYAELPTEFTDEATLTGKNIDNGDWITAIFITAAGLFLFVLCARLMRKYCLQNKITPHEDNTPNKDDTSREDNTPNKDDAPNENNMPNKDDTPHEK
ncbi:MAG: CPBP family intramembrane metalloprotease [Tannerella sp.]|jgi:membrane protease YdiL (CAAX protease family)|nr:CPBP family intramembrane metalloprotease [Tannerella sp.]